jgi:hypothetical protein
MITLDESTGVDPESQYIKTEMVKNKIKNEIKNKKMNVSKHSPLRVCMFNANPPMNGFQPFDERNFGYVITPLYEDVWFFNQQIINFLNQPTVSFTYEFLEVGGEILAFKY